MELDVTKMSGLGLMKCSSMEECSPKESYFIKKNHSTNDVPGMNLNRNLKGNFNETTYQPYIPSYPKINNLHISSPSNGYGSGGGMDLGNSLDHNYSDKHGSNNLKGSYKGSVHSNSNGSSGENGANGGPNCGTYRDNSAPESANGELRTPKPSKSESEHVCLSGKDLEEFRTRQCPLYAKGMCLNSSKCSLSHSETWPRRNPVLFKYDYKLCPNIQFSRHDNKMQLHGKCSFGRRCRFSHSKEEQLYHPELYKTRYCLNFPNCKGYYCPFAHSKEELRNFQPSSNGSSNQNCSNNSLNSTITTNSNAISNSTQNNNNSNKLDGGNGNGNTSNNYTHRGNSNGSNNNNVSNNSVSSGTSGPVINGDFNAIVGSPSNGNVNGMRIKHRTQRDNSGTIKGKNDLGMTAYHIIEDGNSAFNYKNRDEDLLNITTNPDGNKDNSFKFRGEWNSNYRVKDEWNSGLKGKNDDILSNTTSAYSTYNVEELDIDLSSTYDTLSYHNHNASETHKNYNNHKLFKEELDRQLNHGADDDNQRSPRAASDNLYSFSGHVDREELGVDNHDEEEDYNWFESLIKNGLHSLEDNPQPGTKSWMGDNDLQEVFNNLRDCSVDNNCPFCSDKRDYKFTDSEKMVKLSEDLFKPWSAA
ncbi:hypothetical protein MACK_001161 [Theileria orientalis]|uniref:C3H1-type domain-containing protein n=1 Tax=Theileria orientalis TaxID=68886 RepID=A0A976MCG3_THEOR|nr:hypothetical protein MACK_001161 [Theileria orientalis]